MTDIEREIKTLLGSFFQNKDKLELWLETPNPMFGYLVPQEMIIMGRGQKLLDGIKAMLEDNVT